MCEQSRAFCYLFCDTCLSVSDNIAIFEVMLKVCLISCMLLKILKIDSSTSGKQQYSMCHDSQRGEKEPSVSVPFQFLAFPCGLIRGALSNFGLTCSVSADVLSMPKCKYDCYMLIYIFSWIVNFQSFRVVALNSKSQRPTVREEGDSIIIVTCMHKPGHQQFWGLTDAGGVRIFETFPEWSWLSFKQESWRIQKNYVKLSQKFQWKSLPPTTCTSFHLILWSRSNPKTFLTKWSLANAQQKRKGDRSHGTVWHCSNSFHTVSLPVHYDPVQAKDVAALTLYLQRTSFL